MVLRQDERLSLNHETQKITVDGNRIKKHKTQAAVNSSDIRDKNSNLMGYKEKKNELLYPISPYDEIPTIRDLYDQLSPTVRIRPSSTSTQIRQERQDAIRKIYRYEDLKLQDRTGSAIRTFYPELRDDAHEVPGMIEMPTIPTFSEDSELTSEEFFKLHEKDTCNQIPLARDQFYQKGSNYHTIPFDNKLDTELMWPSDEDDVSAMQSKTMAKKHQASRKKLHCFNRTELE